MKLTDALTERFGSAGAVPGEMEDHPALLAMAARGSCRAFDQRSVAPEIVRTLCAVALSAPSKSDLQQRDIVVVRQEDQLRALKTHLADQAWIADVPMILVFCGNNRRQRQVHGWRGHAFVNDHLDAFFNAGVDAAIALGAFVTAAEAVGLGCCPISAVRNAPEAVSDLLGLPDHLFPVAGLALGYPRYPAERISMRVPLDVTVHDGQFSEENLRARIEAYDVARHAHRPYATQRAPETYGLAEPYTWSEDKARQYNAPERAGFGAFVRAKGFRLD